MQAVIDIVLTMVLAAVSGAVLYGIFHVPSRHEWPGDERGEPFHDDEEEEGVEGCRD